MISSMITHKIIAKNTGIDTNAIGMVNSNETGQPGILINEKLYTAVCVKQRQLLKERWGRKTSR